MEVLRAENALLQEQIATNTGIVGNSPPIKRLLELVDRVAPRDTTVLITGESGTGKELIARALHQKEWTPRPSLHRRQLRGFERKPIRERGCSVMKREPLQARLR